MLTNGMRRPPSAMTSENRATRYHAGRGATTRGSGGLVLLDRLGDRADQGGDFERLDEIGRGAELRDALAMTRIAAAGHENRGNGQSHLDQALVEIEATHLTEMNVEHEDRAVEGPGFQASENLGGARKRFDLEPVAPKEPRQGLAH